MVTKAQEKAIKEGLNKGYSGNRIQQELRKKGIGMQRQALQAKIRDIKGVERTKIEQAEAIIVHTPKKYQTEREKKGKKLILGQRRAERAEAERRRIREGEAKKREGGRKTVIKRIKKYFNRDEEWAENYIAESKFSVQRLQKMTNKEMADEIHSWSP